MHYYICNFFKFCKTAYCSPLLITDNHYINRYTYERVIKERQHSKLCIFELFLHIQN